MRACVDIGGTKIAVSLADHTGWRWRESTPTPKSGNRAIVAETILTMLDAGARAVGVDRREIVAVGVSSCGPFRRVDGFIELAAPNICGGHARDGMAATPQNTWHSVPLEQILRASFSQVSIENDAVAALNAECRWGALRGADHCAYATWSTGVGFGLRVDGRTLRGKHGNAGHAGHAFVSENETAPCGCGNSGDLESLISGSALERRFGKPAQTLFAEAAAGSPAAIDALDMAAARFATALYNLALTLDISIVAVGGSVFLGNAAWLLPRIRAHLAEKSALLVPQVSIVPAGLAESVGDFAALSLVAPDDWAWMTAQAA
jgi:glucokinase